MHCVHLLECLLDDWSRSQYDPNPRVREAMGAIWRALVPEPRAAIESHWDAIAGELLTEIGGRLWRNREAACLGLADLLQVRGCLARCCRTVLLAGLCGRVLGATYFEPFRKS